MSGRPARALGAVLPVALLAALSVVLLPAGTAEAAPRTLQGGRLDWGIRSSFQTYVTGPVAKGAFRLKEGAATAGGNLFRFHSATGSHDPGTGSLDAAFTGGVQFQGHRKPDGSHELDLTVSHPVVRIAGGTGTLYVDVAGRAKDTGTVTEQKGVPFASLSLTGANPAGLKGGDDTRIALDAVPATLTEEGAKSFAGYYPAGTALDPVTLSADVRAPGAATSSPSAPPTDGPPGQGAFADAAVDWGVRRTFREYVTGPIGQGGWQLTEGALDGGALFRFPQGKGSYDDRKGTVEAAFAGAVRFTGAHLDLKLGKVTVKVGDGKGVLSADVTAAGRTEPAVALVEFDARGLKAEGGLVTLAEAPATLTGGGSRAFGSLYKPGTEMDPVSLSVALTPSAALPSLPDLGSAGPTAAATAPAAEPSGAAPPAAGESGSGPDAGTYVAFGAAALVLAGGVTGLAVRRRRAAAAARTAAGGPVPQD
ncbi:HtaA domain-containing protein [Streptomyces sp. NPDC089799]|uniref:HtaA domain-containing protein n=1 Tax=Streptomyces sp. NPDC089799 TaxID=3155066 RepID=UPI00343438AC